MSMQQAQAFVERMKGDQAFSAAVFGASSIEERLVIARNAGTPFSPEDLEELHSRTIDPGAQGTNLPISYQCKGPCHTKCAPVIV
ncbi:MAG: Nif11-like leader peptide family natural product precursor [Thiohalocapsa sp. PB-PSB1]|mgnify:CR=1 FL=1|jgi:predicted ribosomally synthesized peptide with nif11-like leader|nr:MAG: hypothetical protein N838_30335 [Thiohalocapsa sp. PB-PSB1]QQO57460.1 MAG: Nif11-like leader peptide family natural product precursor [Thiohalocapsa sp. PB-PSB1]